MTDRNKRYPSELAPKFVLRFPQGMREEIRDIAASNHRSMTAEIIARLEKTLVSERAMADSDNLVNENAAEPYLNELSNYEQQLVTVFRQLPESKRRALIALIS